MFTCELKPLLAALKAAKKVVQTKNPIPVLGYALAEDGALVVTDLDQELILDLPTAKIDLPFLLPVHDMLKLLTGADAGSLVQIVPYEGALTVAVGDLDAAVDTLPVTDFPRMVEPHGAARPVNLSQEEFAQIIGATAVCMSDEETRYYLRGINFCAEGPEGETTLSVVSTDGHRLAHCATGAPFAGEPVIMPAGSVKLALGLPKGAVTLDIYDNRAHLSGNGWELRCKAVDGTFPDHTRVIPQPSGDTVTMTCKSLQAAATKLHKLSPGAAVLDVDAGKLTTTGSDGIKALGVTLSMDVDGEPVTQGYNAKYLADMAGLAAMFDDIMVLGASNADEPALVVPDRQPDFGKVRFVIMPMRRWS